MVAKDEIAGVVLAAGAGTRLRPLTDERPKAMCPVGNVPLVDHAMARVAPYAGSLAVNVHATQPTLRDHVAGRAHVSLEREDRLGTAGALGHLRGWVDGRHVLVHNADSFVDDDLDALLDGWTGEHPRLLVRDDGGPRDFGSWTFLGVSLLPSHLALALPDAVAGLHRLVWLPAWEAGTLETIAVRGTAIDCGTPSDYLRANLHVSRGASVVGVGAVVEGSVTRCVVWPGARVERGEHLVESIRTPRTTVAAPLG
ncbi:MAG TPA: sugar phosphate nucleotidyltransferase [Candidatus Nanopelagicales bacterium]|nr:sugar phosphate nucleotidyltransferase [Candidatus Nanopelagicales bacterium]